MESSEQDTSHFKRKRTANACARCRARKVRCDASWNPGSECTNCRLDGIFCNPTEKKTAIGSKWRNGLKRRRPNASAHRLTKGQRGTPFESMVGLGCSQSSWHVEQQAVGSTAGDSPQSVPQHPYQWQNLTTLDGTDTIAAASFSFPSVLPQYSSVPSEATVTGTAFDIETPNVQRLTSNAPPVLPSFIAPLPDFLGKDDIGFLDTKYAFHVPDVPLRNSLISAFVDYVYPFLPMVDLTELLCIVSQEDGSNGQISLLVFQSIMLAGSAFVDLNHLLAAGYDSRRAARTMLLKKVRILYEFDVEQSNTSLIQALLLVTCGFEEPGDRKDMWHWMSIIVTISHTCGLHHCPENETNSYSENLLNKKLWWCIFTQNQHIAFMMRRRARVHYKDRIPMLQVSDIDCNSMPEHLAGVFPECKFLQDCSLREKLARVCIERSKLVILISEVMSIQFKSKSLVLPRGEGVKSMLVPKQRQINDFRVVRCQEKLEDWCRQIPQDCVYNSDLPNSGLESPCLTVHKAALKLEYLITFGTLRCPHVLPFSPSAASAFLAIGAARNAWEDFKMTFGYISLDIRKTGMELQSWNLIRYLPPATLPCFLSAMLMQLLSVQSCPMANLTECCQSYSDCYHIVSQLCQIYPIAEPVSKFMEKLALGEDMNIQESQQQTLGSKATEPHRLERQVSGNGAFNFSSTNLNVDANELQVWDFLQCHNSIAPSLGTTNMSQGAWNWGI